MHLFNHCKADLKYVLSRVNDIVKKVDSSMKLFKTAHKDYAEHIKETNDEEGMDAAIQEYSTY